MTGKIIKRDSFFEVEYEHNGIIKHIGLVEDTDTRHLYTGLEVYFEEVWIGNPEAHFTTETGWNMDPIKELRAELVGRYYGDLYGEIEHLIITWSIDGTKTAGSLTREIMETFYKHNQKL